MDLRTLLTDHYAPSRLNLGEDTVRHMLTAIKRLDDSRGVKTRVVELSGPLIVAHLKWLKELEFSARQINVRRGYLITLWRWAYRNGLTNNDPNRVTIDTIREPKRKPVAWSLAHLEAMLQQAREFEPRGNCVFGGREWESLILLLYYTGLRITAALKLKRTNLQGRLLFVPHEIQKDNEEQLIRLPSDLVNLLVSLRRPRREVHGRIIGDHLIPWPWSFHDPQKRLSNHILKPADLPDSHLLKFHAIRKTTATVVAAKAGKLTAQEILGHSSSRVTERYLADPHMVDPSLAPNFAPMDVMPKIG